MSEIMNAELEPQKVEPPKQAHEETGDLEAYRKFVAERARAADGQPFFNRSAAHAAIVIEYLFRDASREMKILTGELFQPVYGDAGVIQAAIEFLAKYPTAEIRIISEKPIDRLHPFLRGLADSGFGQRVTTSILNPDVAAKTPIHFAVADGRSFRFEPNKKLMEAVIQFGDESLGNHLNEFFEHLKNNN